MGLRTPVERRFSATVARMLHQKCWKWMSRRRIQVRGRDSAPSRYRLAQALGAPEQRPNQRRPHRPKNRPMPGGTPTDNRVCDHTHAAASSGVESPAPAMKPLPARACQGGVALFVPPSASRQYKASMDHQWRQDCRAAPGVVRCRRFGQWSDKRPVNTAHRVGAGAVPGAHACLRAPQNPSDCRALA
jgi:hypothetical protein